MGSAIGGSLALAVGIAVSPVPIIAVVLILTSGRARVNGLAFIVGWLAGLGVRLHRNGPRRPRENTLVERSQRTGKEWADPGRCDTPEELQRRLDEEDQVQRAVDLFDGKQITRHVL